MKHTLGLVGLALIGAGLAWFHIGLGLIYVGILCCVVADVI